MLRNAFDNLGTEAALRKIANLLTFARDSLDRMRIIVDSGTVSVYNRNSTTALQGNDSVAPFSNHSWNIMDSREEQRIRMRMAADSTRKNRWTY